MIEKYNVSSVAAGSYIIEVDNNLIISSSIKPNNRKHWVVGVNFSWLETYYYKQSPLTEIEEIHNYKINKC